jgi:alkylation response protein AidB-like acyl-CoA dehydrogenase
MSRPTDEQRELRGAVSALLAKRSDSAAVRRAVDSPDGYDRELWRVLCDQIGVAALAVPERFGGGGAGQREVQIVHEELGRALTPSPLLATTLATALLTHLDDDGAASRLLPPIAEGAVVAVAWADAEGTWGGGAVSARAGRLRGEAHYVLDGVAAEILLVIAEGAVYEVDPSAVLRTPTPAMDITRRLARVALDGVPATRIGPADASAARQCALDAALVALAGEQVGAAAAALELTVQYTKVRQQFGRPIGSFQALKHRMADLYVRLEAARSAAYAAADGALRPDVAKIYCSDALSTIAGEAIQLHGGIAITWEHDAHLYFKRAHGSAALFGAPGEHRARLAAELAGSRSTQPSR